MTYLQECVLRSDRRRFVSSLKGPPMLARASFQEGHRVNLLGPVRARRKLAILGGNAARLLNL
jgi:hypothetical protein